MVEPKEDVKVAEPYSEQKGAKPVAGFDQQAPAIPSV